MKIRRGTLKEAMPLIIAHHYTRRRTADPVYVFILEGDQGDEAAAIFTSPANRYFGKGSLELARLVRIPECVIPMTQFLAKVIRMIRKEKRFKYLLSYADTTAGHHGGVYQAANFKFIRESRGGAMFRHPDGRVVSGRSMDQSSEEYKQGFVRLPPGKKFLYVYPLTEGWDSLSARFGWTALPFPKPNPAEATR